MNIKLNFKRLMNSKVNLIQSKIDFDTSIIERYLYLRKSFILEVMLRRRLFQSKIPAKLYKYEVVFDPLTRELKTMYLLFVSDGQLGQHQSKLEDMVGQYSDDYLNGVSSDDSRYNASSNWLKITLNR